MRVWGSQIQIVAILYAYEPERSSGVSAYWSVWHEQRMRQPLRQWMLAFSLAEYAWLGCSV
jgi:hypothetical protein